MLRLVSLLAVLFAFSIPAHAKTLQLESGDHICMIGNTLADRMQHDGWFEAMLQLLHPQHELVIRNLGFSGDEINLRLRSAGFGSPDDHLRENQADVIFAFFGYNESFSGEEGLDTFRTELRQLIEHLRSEQYNGESAPRIVIVSPIAHENLGNPKLPDGRANNERLAVTTSAMRDVATEMDVCFVDLFTPTRKAYDEHDEPLTLNGIHLNSDGNRVVADLLRAQLWPESKRIDWTAAASQQVRDAVLDKNFYWFNRYRTTDGYSIFGGRADLTFTDGQTNRVVMQREMEILRVMTSLRDRAIWAAAQGRQFTVDDAQTPDFIPVVTNKPGQGPNGEHLFLSDEAAIDTMTVAEGLKVQVFASEAVFPELINPVQMAFDTSGRLWVSAWESYPHWKPKDVMDDKLLILEDRDGDGRADHCKTFAGGLHNPTGFEFYGKGVLVAMAPDLVYLEDTDGDDVADVRRRVLHGICSADTHHTANSFVLDPGGGVYFQEGTFHHTQVETPYGPPVRSANAAVFRFEPMTSKFDVYVAYGFANPHGHVFDRWGQDFVHDGTGAVPYHGALFSGHLDFPAKHSGPPTLYKQRTRPCPATELVSGSHFPPEMQGNLLVGNVIGFQGILQYKLKDRGASFEGEEVEPILYSSDPNFRPVDLEIAPDGTLYFVDWQNPIIGHMQHNLRDPSRDRKHGRVYRVVHEQREVMPAVPIAGQPIDQLVGLLADPADRIRYRAKIELAGHDSQEVVAAVERWLSGLDPDGDEFEHHRLEALWVHQYHDVVNDALLKQVLASPDFRARAAAVRVLCHWRDRVPESLALLKVAAVDAHPRVRLEAVRAASFYQVAEAIEVALLTTDLPTDEYLDYVRNETMRALEPYWKSAIEAGQPIAVTSEVGMRWLLQRVRVDELVRMPRSRAVHRELLMRDDVQEEYRREALQALAADEEQSMVLTLLTAIHQLDVNDSTPGALFDLGRILTSMDASALRTEEAKLRQLVEHGNSPTARQLGLVALLMSGESVDRVADASEGTVKRLKDFIGAVTMVPDPLIQDQMAERIEPYLNALPAALASQYQDQTTDRGTYGRYVRIELPGRQRTLTLAEVQVMSDGRNIARQGKATQSATAHGGTADRAIDGNTSPSYGGGGQTHTPENSANPWWELDLGDEYPLESIVVYNRVDGQLGNRLNGFTLKVLDGGRATVHEQKDIPAPQRSETFQLEAGGPQGTIRRAAMQSLPFVRGRETDTFRSLAEFVSEDVDRTAAMRALIRIPARFWPVDEVPSLLGHVMNYVRSTPSDQRSMPAVVDAIQLADGLAAALPPDQAAQIRKELRALGVRRLRLGTVPHRMVYDKERLVIEAGKPVELYFENGDIMPHNFVITVPGALEEVGLLAEATAQQPGALQRQFVPETDKILVSSQLLQPRESQTLQFTAPTKPGIYPFVCTYPGHWRRMYGSLYVVADLDAYEADHEGYVAAAGLAAVDELLKTIRPSQQWKLEDLEPALSDFDHGRSFASGRRMFQLASCASCHRMNGEGNEFGPDLTKLDVKLTPLQVLKHIVEPSSEINKDYQTSVLELESGKVVTGLIVAAGPGFIKIVENPLVDAQPRKVQMSEIETNSKSTQSLMPEGLLDKLTRDEILDLLAYVFSRGNDQHALFQGGHDHHH